MKTSCVCLFVFRRIRISREKRLLASSRISVYVYQRGSLWSDFREVRYCWLSCKSVEKLQIWLKLDKNIGHCTWRP